jgi:formate-dependent nitrite reductase membrane component NrfD
VIVCPTQAIFAGDLDDAGSNVSRIVATQKTSVRKAEKGTTPKLFYVGIEPDLLDPTRLSRQTGDMFSDRRVKPEKSQAADAALTREVYDVAHPAPWGWKIAAYLWTKSIAAGVMLVAAIVMLWNSDNSSSLFCIAAPLIALAALGATSLLLILDLKRPGRFFYLLTKPNFKSWLVLGAYVLMAYGALIGIWLWFGVFKHHVPGAISAATAMLAAGSACYSGFLFAQAKGRDLWQGPVFFLHLLVHAVICGSATLFLMDSVSDEFSGMLLPLGWVLVISLIASLIMILLDVVVPHGSADVRLALRVLTRGRLSIQFWGLAICVGILLPLGFAVSLMFGGAGDFALFLFPIHALAGVWFFEDVWVKAGQVVPLS